MSALVLSACLFEILWASLVRGGAVYVLSHQAIDNKKKHVYFFETISLFGYRYLSRLIGLTQSRAHIAPTL